MVSSKQVAGTAFIFATVASVCAFFVLTFMNFLELPEVHVGPDDKCIKVINYKNGDAYNCQDRDVVLRKYRIVK